jgi:hypothetical protein
VRDPDRPRQVGEEDRARLERCDEQRLEAVVVEGDRLPELGDTPRDLVAREVDVPDRGSVGYEASLS